MGPRKFIVYLRRQYLLYLCVDSICLRSFKYDIFCVRNSTEGTSGLYAARTGISPQGYFITNALFVVFRRSRKVPKSNC